MLYRPEINTAIEFLDNITGKNRKIIASKLDLQIKFAESILNNQCEIASHLIAVLPFGFTGDRDDSLSIIAINELLLSCFHKNVISLYSALTLSVNGLYGAARPLLRNAYEWLIVGKFCNLSHDVKVLSSWNNHGVVYFTNGVLKKIEEPDNEIFKQFWTMLSQFTHATKYSIQGTIDVMEEDNFLNVNKNLVLITALLECNYHLLNTHLFNRDLEYLARVYVDNSDSRKSIAELRKNAKVLFKENKSAYGKSTISLVTSYKKKWKIMK